MPLLFLRGVVQSVCGLGISVDSLGVFLETRLHKERGESWCGAWFCAVLPVTRCE